MERELAVGGADNERAGRFRYFARIDVIGAGLGLSGAAWTILTSGATAAAMRVAGVYLAAVASFFVARTIVRRSRPWLPAFAVVVFAAVVAMTDGRTYSAGRSDRFWYANARAAFFAFAAIAAVMVLTSTDRPLIRVFSWGALAGFAVVPMASRAVAVSVVLVVILGAAVIRGNRSTTSIGAWLALFAVAVSFTVCVGVLAAHQRPRSGLVVRAVGERRVALWADAAHLVETHPLAGTGAGRFQATSPIARADRDARWAHNGFLQQGAEAGVIGLAIAVAIFLWALAAVASGSGPAAALGVACVAALGILSCVDFLLHFFVLPVMAAALAGVGAAGD